MNELTKDEPSRETIACVVCGRVVPIEKSRLFWGTNGTESGTYRTCAKGDRPHEARKRR
jgi:hypothetical protein